MLKTAKILILTSLLLFLTTCVGFNQDKSALSRGSFEEQDLNAVDSEAFDPGEIAFDPDHKGPEAVVPSTNRYINKGLSMVGIPAFLPEGDSQDDFRRPTEHLSAAERMRRNPDGSTRQQSSTVLDADVSQVGVSLLRQALSAGSSSFNTWAEGWLSGYGKAKVNVTPSLDGNVTGSIDFLTPIYDSELTAVISQFGLRTMPGERIIGNMGLGQRFFIDDMAFGYNAFLDQDFTRGHVRGGLGLELWYDWVRVSGNYYRPLSRWQASKDLDGRYIQERPAEGWDARLTGYLPFYKQLAVNTAVEQWLGDYVAPFGVHDRLYKEPKVYVVGLDWTPVPLVSVSGETRSSKDHTETRVGLSLNYYFGVPLEEQLTASNVTELRSIENSRHDFVNRQNEMILEYRATPGKYLIKVFSRGNNTLEVVVTDFFGIPIKNLPVKIVS
jgi:hypothetical protein